MMFRYNSNYNLKILTNYEQDKSKLLNIDKESNSLFLHFTLFIFFGEDICILPFPAERNLQADYVQTPKSICKNLVAYNLKIS